MSSKGAGPIEGIVFDLWNTLCYSEFQPNPMLLIAESLGIAEELSWKKRIERGMMTRRFLDFRDALASLERDSAGGVILEAAARTRLARQWNEAVQATRLFDDAIPALQSLRSRFRIGLLSNTQSFGMDFFRASGLEPFFDAVCLSCDEGRLKPDPLIFAAVAAKLRLPADRILMVGDSVEDDVQGGLQAGFAAIHLDRAGTAPPVPSALGRVRLLTAIPSLVA